MREFFQNLESKDHDGFRVFDGFNFFKNEDGDTEITGFAYNVPGDKINGTNLGEMYDIIILQDNPPKMPERFGAILTSPMHYMSRMIEQGFYGIVARMTTTSEKIIDTIFSEMEKETQEYIQNHKKEINNV